jgi:hypothetical protein
LVRLLVALLGHADPFVQLSALAALPTLFGCAPSDGCDHGHSPLVQKQFHEAPLHGMHALTTVLQKSNKPDVLIKAAYLVYVACLLCAEAGAAFVRQGGANYLTQLLTYATFPGLQTAACFGVLGVCYQNPAHQKFFLEQKAVERLLPLLSTPSSSSSSSSSPASPDKADNSPTQYAAAYALASLAYQNPSTQGELHARGVLTTIMGWLPPAHTVSDRSRNFQYKTALRCLAEMLSPTPITRRLDPSLCVQEQMPCVPELQLSVWSTLRLSRFYQYMHDPELTPAALTLLGNCVLHNPQVHADLLAHPNVAMWSDRLAVLLTGADSTVVSTQWTPLTSTMSTASAAYVALAQLTQQAPPRLVHKLLTPSLLAALRISVGPRPSASSDGAASLAPQAASLTVHTAKRKHDAMAPSTRDAAPGTRVISPNHLSVPARTEDLARLAPHFDASATVSRTIPHSAVDNVDEKQEKSPIAHPPLSPSETTATSLVPSTAVALPQSTSQRAPILTQR